MRACPGHCAMHHECPCADKLERHPQGGVADTPGTTRSPKAIPGAQLQHALNALRVEFHGDVVDLGPAGALRRSIVTTYELQAIEARRR